MAIFRIKRADSVFTTVTNAFDSDSPGADSLIVDPGAHLISAGGSGAYLNFTGAWSVNVNGSIFSSGPGILLEATNPGISTINIGVDGEVTGIWLRSSANINNAGIIAATSGFAIQIENAGTHVITNSGIITPEPGLATILDNNGLSNETVRNSGTIHGDIILSGGNDTVTNFAIVGDVIKSGTITGGIFLGAGNDTFIGGANAETVPDSDGADTYKFGGGNDTYIATGNTGSDGIDTVRGGGGKDTYDGSAAFGGIFINLDSVAHGTLLATTATGTDVSGAAKDTIFGFENANGGSANDNIFGSAAGNALSGGDSNDGLTGFGGNDTLDGGVGNDALFGGAGKDKLTGGPGLDVFHYTKLSDSGITAATRDLIADFEQGTDVIGLVFIDANKTTAGDDAFTFIGTNTLFTGTPGQLHAFWSAIGQIIEGDVNGDKKADFSIEIADPARAITLSNASFGL
jgi:Ca2+-binding RTX toxin-like protein